jgi:hypothetical protein
LGVEIDARQLQVHRRLRVRFIPGVEDPLGLASVSRLEADLNSVDFVFEVEHAPGAADQTVSLLHRFTHGLRVQSGQPFRG